jgi:hypothetical protein
VFPSLVADIIGQYIIQTLSIESETLWQEILIQIMITEEQHIF